MHPAYTLYIGLGARVAEWKSDMYATVNKAFALPIDDRVQVRWRVWEVENVCLRRVGWWEETAYCWEESGGRTRGIERMVGEEIITWELIDNLSVFLDHIVVRISELNKGDECMWK